MSRRGSGEAVSSDGEQLHAGVGGSDKRVGARG